MRDELLGGDGLHALADWLAPGLRDLELINVGTRADGVEALSRCAQLESLRRLTLTRNPLAPRATKVLSLPRSLSGLRSLVLSECRLGDKGLRHIVA